MHSGIQGVRNGRECCMRAFCFSLACVKKKKKKKNGNVSENCQYRRTRVFEIEEIIACVHSVLAWLL